MQDLHARRHALILSSGFVISDVFSQLFLHSTYTHDKQVECWASRIYNFFYYALANFINFNRPYCARVARASWKITIFMASTIVVLKTSIHNVLNWLIYCTINSIEFYFSRIHDEWWIFEIRVSESLFFIGRPVHVLEQLIIVWEAVSLLK